MYGLHFAETPIQPEVTGFHAFEVKGVEEMLHCAYFASAFVGAITHYEHAHTVGGWASLALLILLVASHFHATEI